MEGHSQAFVIRQMLPADIDSVAEIEQLANPSPWNAEQFRAELDNSLSSTDLLLVGNEIAAYICSWKIVDELQIQNIATAPRFRRRGLAAELLSEVLRRSVNDGALRVFLEVRVSNAAAQALYEKFGFTRQGVRAEYYADNEDALLMELAMGAYRP